MSDLKAAAVAEAADSVGRAEVRAAVADVVVAKALVAVVSVSYRDLMIIMSRRRDDEEKRTMKTKKESKKLV